MEGNTKEKMDPAKPLLRLISSFQVLQKTIYGASGTSSFPPQAPNENNKVENPDPTRLEVSSAALIDSTSKLVEQFQETNIDTKKLRRIMSNRLSAQRSRLKKMRFLANLEIQAKAYEVSPTTTVRSLSRDLMSRNQILAQIAELQPQEASYLKQLQFFMEEQQILEQEMKVLQKETLFRDAEIEMNKGEVNRLRELQAMQQEQLQALLLNWNIGMLEQVPIDSITTYYTNSYQGNGVEIPYIPLEPSQMWTPAVPNMHETNMTLPNYYMGSMDQTNLISGTAPNPNLK